MANEKRLIDANALLGRAIREKRFVFHREDLLRDEIIVKTVYGDLAEFINEQPTVDAVEVPCRCKDCRKCAIYDDVITRVKQYVCRAQNGHREVDADAFCSYGEKREGERREGE